MDDSGQLVGAWSIDTERISTNVNIGAVLGARTSLPRSATVLPSNALLAEVQAAVDTNGTGVVAWIGSTQNGPTSVQVATLTTGQAPQIAPPLAVCTSASQILSLDVGFDGSHHPVVTWAVTPANGPGPSSIAVARGNGQGGFAPTVETQVESGLMTGLQTAVLSNGGLLATWATGSEIAGAGTAKFSQAGPTGPWSAAQTLASGVHNLTFAANPSGRAAVLFTTPVGNNSSLRAQLRTAGGRSIGRTNVGVDATGRVVALWDDGTPGGSGPSRVLAAR